MRIILEIKNQDIIDVIDGALEGGSNYWYNLPDLSMLKYPGKDSLGANIFYSCLDGVIIPVSDIETDEEIGYISQESIELGIKYYFNDLNRINFNDADAWECDTMFQYIVLGEIVYG